MKHFLLAIAIVCVTGLKANEEKSLQLGLGYGLYCQTPYKGTNFSFFIDYRINKNYTLGPMSQFGFINAKVDEFRANYVNQHISLLLKRNLFDSKCIQVFAGAGAGYTNYHTAEVRHMNAGDSHQRYLNTQSKVQLAFPVMLELNCKLSKTISIGTRIGGYIPTQGQGGYFNYRFVNPHLRFSL